MAAYTATFSRGETKSIANSTRDYSAAWLIEARDTTGEHSSNVIKMGFARDRRMAESAAAREFASLNSVARWKRHRLPGKRWALVHTEVVDVTAA